MKRYGHNLSHTETSTVNMGTCIPGNIIEVFPGDSFKIQAKDLTRFLPQVAPTMHDVFVGIDTYQVPLRQIFDKLHLDWDAYLTGGEDGTTEVNIPQIIIPQTGYEPGSLADFLGYPTNYTDPSTNEKVIVAAGREYSALPVLVYMHIINENYRDQNFIKKFDFTKYQEFLDGTYTFYDAVGNEIEYDLQREGLFPKAWSRDYYGRALPNTQRGVEARVPLGSTADLEPSYAVVSTGYKLSAGTSNIKTTVRATGSAGSTPTLGLSTLQVGGASFSGYYLGTTFSNLSASDLAGFEDKFVKLNSLSTTDLDFPLNVWIKIGEITASGTADATWDIEFMKVSGNATDGYRRYVRTRGSSGNSSSTGTSTGAIASNSSNQAFEFITESFADLAGVKTNLSEATAASIIAFRTAARMQQFGEQLQQAGARAVEYTLKMFGVRIPDGRIQRPLFHGSFRMPVVFSEVLQTSQTTDTSTLATLAGHGITGGVNRPIHIKVIEHGFIMSIMHIMPRSQFQNIAPRYLFRKTRWDMPNPLFQGIGEQGMYREEIYPNSSNPREYFGFVPQYSELMSIPSTLHGHMKDTFLHWTMARVYTDEPVLSAAWRYELPSDRSFAVQNEDQMQVCIGYEIHSRRKFKNNPRPGIHIV